MLCVWSSPIQLEGNSVRVFTVANVSDFFQDFQCTAPTVWFRRRPTLIELSSPLDPTTTSYNPDTGLARIFSNYIRDPQNLVEQDGILTLFLLCVSSIDFVPASLNLIPGIYLHSYIAFFKSVAVHSCSHPTNHSSN